MRASVHNLGPFGLEVGINRFHEGLSDLVVLSFFDLVGAEGKDGEIFGVVSVFNSRDDSVFEGLGEQGQVFVAVELGAMLDSTGPREDGCDRVGGG